MDSSESFTPDARPLPDNFAEQLMDLELSIERQCTMDELQKVLEMYSQAMEYYESINDPRFIQYQTRMQELLLKDSVIRVMRGEKQPKQPEEQKQDEIVQKEVERDMNIKRLRRKTAAPEANSVRTERGVQDLVRQNHVTTQNTYKTVSANLRSQESTLEKRLAQRRKLKLNTSFQEPKFDRGMSVSSGFMSARGNRPAAPLLQECDMACGTRSDYSDELEKIMEYFVLEKITRKKEIKSTYLPQIKDLEGNDGMFKAIVDDLNKCMDEEIEECVRALDSKKQKMIDELKSRY